MAIRERIPYEQCPLCEEKKFEVVRQVDILLGELTSMTLERKLQWRQCADCTHIYADGYWSVEIMEKILELMPPMGLDMRDERTYWSRIVEKILRFGPGCNSELEINDDARWLDVGFGHGCGLGVAEEYGFEVLGIDIRKWAVDIMVAWGYTVQKCSFDEFAESAKLAVGCPACAGGGALGPEGDDECGQCNGTGVDPAPPPSSLKSWDVIVMAEFLEHCSFPVDALKKAKALLRPGGVVYASSPSRDCAIWRARDVMQAGGPGIAGPGAGEPEMGWKQIEHYHIWGRKQFEDCFRSAGLEPVAFHVGERYFGETIEVIGR